MKTLVKQIRILALATVLIFSISTYAQKEAKMHNLFVRVYNLEGKKIGKGPIVFINDSVICLKNNSPRPNINIKDIGFIKTKHSVGHDVLVGSLIGGVSGALVGGATSKEVTKTVDLSGFFGLGEYEYKSGTSSGEGAVIFGVLGALGGGAFGGLISFLKNSETYIISANEYNWKSFQKIIEEKQKR